MSNLTSLRNKVLHRFMNLRDFKRFNTRILAQMMCISYNDAFIKNFTEEQCKLALEVMNRYEDNYMSDDSANEHDYPYECLLGPFY